MNDIDISTTTVIDAGARYGMHPTWREFSGSLRYFAFEPDKQEAERLRQQPQHPGFEVIDWGLTREEGERDLHITKHRGCCSFLKVDQESEWFTRYRPGEGDLESIVQVKTCSVDGFAKARRVQVDFLKVDTEGTELEVLEGAQDQLCSSVMGVRVNVNFQPVYKNQPLFQDIHTYLTTRDFFLLNIDYFGRGLPHYGLFRNPDPLSLDNERYGVLIGTDGVWVKKYSWIFQRYGQEPEELSYVILKYAYFLFLNHAPDVGLDTLVRFITDRRGAFGQKVAASQLYLALRKAYAAFLGRWRVYPDAQWELARSTFKTIFGLEMEGGNKYWELIQSL